MTDNIQTWVNATIIIQAADQQGVQTALADPTLFVTPASPSGQEPATAFFTSGPWSTATMDEMTRKAFPFDIKVRDPDWQVALAGEGLVMIVEVAPLPADPVPEPQPMPVQ